MLLKSLMLFFFFSSRRRHTRYWRDWSSDVCSSDLWHILRRKKEGVEDWIDKSVEKIGAVPTLNQVLLPAMKEVGDKFGAGELILPFVLQSAEVMKRAVAQLENYLDRKSTRLNSSHANISYAVFCLK